MGSDLPPLNWLRAFEASARTLSFTGAARDLNMTQSAVSQQIKALEAHMGRPLFHRRHRALELTQTGLSYLPVVREAFRTLSQGTAALTRATSGVLNLQCNLSFAIFWLAPRLGAFRAAHPDIQLNIATELWEPRDIAEDADVEIRFSLQPSHTSQADLIASDHFYPVCVPGYVVTLETLAQQPLFDCSNMMGTWAVWAEEQGLTWPNTPVTYATTYSVALSAAQSGVGLCLAHDAIARGLIDAGKLVAPFGTRVAMPEAYYLIETPRPQQRKHAKAFADWLRSELAAFYKGRDGTQA